MIGIGMSLSVYANNIEVNNVTLTGQNQGDQFTLVQFDLSWENSWRISAGPSNYDGAWVFVKYRQNSGPWQHGTINYVNGTAAADGHTAPSGATIQTSSDGVGVWVYRDSDGSGDVNYQSIQLRWNYGSDGVSSSAVVDVQVFAIEMVNIPEGLFLLGSNNFGGDETDHFYYNTGVFGSQSPFPVTSEDAITVSNISGPTNLFYDIVATENQGDQLGPIPAEYPKGFAAFWVMKYEITEDQWLCFFNSLTDTQKDNHDVTDADHKNTDAVVSRNTIAYTSGNGTTLAPNRAISFLNYNDCAAYLDWTGLRFITELEYEKASKGPVHVNNALATGGTAVFDELYNINNDGEADAIITNPGENITNMCYFINDPGGPMRVGIFAASAVNNTREETGGSYFGVMELSGNLYERCIGVGTPLNRGYEGTHGDGELTFSGQHNVLTWPAPGSEGAHAYRGGSWSNDIGFCRTADRTSACILNSVTNSRIGLRGGRTAE